MRMKESTRRYITKIMLSIFQNLVGKSKYITIFCRRINNELNTWRTNLLNNFLNNDFLSSVLVKNFIKSVFLVTPETITRNTQRGLKKIFL